MSRICLIALVAVCAMLALAAAEPRNSEHARGRQRHAHLARRRPVGSYGSRSHQAPAYAAPEEPAADEEAEEVPAPVEDEPQDDQPEQGEAEQDDAENEEEAPAAFKSHAPAHPGRAARPSADSNHGGVSAVATAYSKGKGATSNSHAAAYGGHFSGGQFKHRF